MLHAAVLPICWAHQRRLTSSLATVSLKVLPLPLSAFLLSCANSLARALSSTCPMEVPLESPDAALMRSPSRLGAGASSSSPPASPGCVEADGLTATPTSAPVTVICGWWCSAAAPVPAARVLFVLLLLPRRASAAGTDSTSSIRTPGVHHA